MKLILRPIEDSETITELIGTGADLNGLPKLIWENDKGIQDFLIKQMQHYRSKATGCHSSELLKVVEYAIFFYLSLLLTYTISCCSR